MLQGPHAGSSWNSSSGQRATLHRKGNFFSIRDGACAEEEGAKVANRTFPVPRVACIRLEDEEQGERKPAERVRESRVEVVERAEAALVGVLQRGLVGAAGERDEQHHCERHDLRRERLQPACAKGPALGQEPFVRLSQLSFRRACQVSFQVSFQRGTTLSGTFREATAASGGLAQRDGLGQVAEVGLVGLPVGAGEGAASDKLLSAHWEVVRDS